MTDCAIQEKGSEENMTESPSKKRYYRLKEAGICTTCGRVEAYKGHLKCLVCMMDDRERMRGKKESPEKKARRKARMLELKEKGLCYYCRQPNDDGQVYCKACRDKINRRKRARYVPKYRPEWRCFSCFEHVVEGYKYCQKHLDNARRAAAIRGKQLSVSNKTHVWRKHKTKKSEGSFES